MILWSDVIGTKFDLKATISRIEKSLIWRRVNKVYDVEAMAKEVEPEVSISTERADIRL